MVAKYKHTNIIAKDWRHLATFYEKTFSCTPVPPQRKQSGKWLQNGTGVENASLEGVHLRLPGYGENAPTLEIYQYHHNEPKPTAVANRQGFMHIAFEVDSVHKYCDMVMANGGSMLGQITTTTVAGVGNLEFVYVRDPEGNIIELQSWN